MIVILIESDSRQDRQATPREEKPQIAQMSADSRKGGGTFLSPNGLKWAGWKTRSPLSHSLRFLRSFAAINLLFAKRSCSGKAGSMLIAFLVSFELFVVPLSQFLIGALGASLRFFRSFAAIYILLFKLWPIKLNSGIDCLESLNRDSPFLFATFAIFARGNSVIHGELPGIQPSAFLTFVPVFCG